MHAHKGSPARRPLRSILALVVAGLVAFATPLAVASPAFAHEQLIGADPAAFAVLGESPAAVTLSFSGELSTDQGATEVQVLDAAGTVVNDGDAVTGATTVTQAVSAELANGDYRVLWKVVAGDGHPISGEYSFTVQAAEPVPTNTPSQSAAPSDEPSEVATSAPPADESPAAVEEAADASSAVPWVLLGVVAAAILGGVVYLLLSRARRRRDTDAIRASQAASLSPGTDAVPPQSPPDTDR